MYVYTCAQVYEKLAPARFSPCLRANRYYYTIREFTTTTLYIRVYTVTIGGDDDESSINEGDGYTHSAYILELEAVAGFVMLVARTATKKYPNYRAAHDAIDAKN